MASSKNEMRFHIRSVGNIAQVTHALEAVSISKARKSTKLLKATSPYVERAWKMVLHIARQPEGEHEHPFWRSGLIQKKPWQLLFPVIAVWREDITSMWCAKRCKPSMVIRARFLILQLVNAELNCLLIGTKTWWQHLQN